MSLRILSWLSCLAGLSGPSTSQATTTTKADIDLTRLIRCIEHKEQNKWHRPGGALGFTKATWSDFSPHPYSDASKPSKARITAQIMLKSTIRDLEAADIHPTPYLLALRWRFGQCGMVMRLHDGIRHQYGDSVENLYNDPTFQPK